MPQVLIVVRPKGEKMYSTPGIDVLPIPGEEQHASVYISDISPSRIIFLRQVFAASLRLYEVGTSPLVSISPEGSVQGVEGLQ